MNKNKLKFWVDILMFLDFLLVSISGFVLWLVLPRGSGKFGESFIFSREQWLWLHDWSSVILITLILIHLILNWIWIKSMFFGLFRKKENAK